MRPTASSGSNYDCVMIVLLTKLLIFDQMLHYRLSHSVTITEYLLQKRCLIIYVLAEHLKPIAAVNYYFVINHCHYNLYDSII